MIYEIVTVQILSPSVRILKCHPRDSHGLKGAIVSLHLRLQTLYGGTELTRATTETLSGIYPLPFLLSLSGVPILASKVKFITSPAAPRSIFGIAESPQTSYNL